MSISRTLSALLLGAAAAATALPALALDTARILAWQPVAFDAAAKQASPRRLALSVGDRPLLLAIEPNATLTEALDPTRADAAYRGGNLFLRGVVEGRSGSWVRLARIAGAWSGAIHDGATLTLLDRAGDVASMLALAPPDADATIAYRLDDVVAPGLIDDVIAVPGAAHLGPRRAEGDAYRRFVAHLLAGRAAHKAAGASAELQFTIVTDTEFSALHGANRDAVVLARLNFADGVYTSQLGVQLVAARIVHLTANETLTTTDGPQLLNAFRSYMTTGAGSGIPKGGLNHLFSGKDFDGSTAGVAFLGVLCSASFGYGVNEVRSNSGLASVIFAHEAGHNFGAPHDGQDACAGTPTGQFIMSPTVSGALSSFSTCSVTQMADDVARASCLVDLTTAIFRNGFE